MGQMYFQFPTTPTTTDSSTGSQPIDCGPPALLSMGILQARKLEWVAISFSRELPNPGIEPSLPHCKRILYHLSHQRSPRILQWIAYPFSRGIF